MCDFGARAEYSKLETSCRWVEIFATYCRRNLAKIAPGLFVRLLNCNLSSSKLQNVFSAGTY